MGGGEEEGGVEMYDYTKETIYLLGSKSSNVFPLVKVVADTRGIKIYGQSAAQKGQEAHAERWAEDECGRLDKTHGHLHLRDDKAIENWQDETYKECGARPGVRGGCQTIPPLEELGGYLSIVTWGYRLKDAMSQKAKPKHYKQHYLEIDLDDFASESLYVEVLLKGYGSKVIFSNIESGNIWRSVVFDKKEPHIIFAIKDKL